MSKSGIAAFALLVTMASLSYGQSAAYEVYQYGSGAVGMRFGDAPQVATVRGADGQIDYKVDPNGGYGFGGGGFGCPNCGGAAGGCGICLDWKLNTWYGSWDHNPHNWHGRNPWCDTCGDYASGGGCPGGNCGGGF